MSNATGTDYYAMVEQAWALSTNAREYAKASATEVSIQEVVDKVFVPSGLVDIEKTQREGGNPPKIFLKSPYGLQYRPEQKDWIPFRHGPVTL